MAEVATVSMQGVREKSPTLTVLGASDTVPYEKGKGQILVIVPNVTSGSVTPNIVGNSAPTALEVPGGGTKDLSGGYTWAAAVADGKGTFLPLDTIREYLEGTTVTLTAADDAEAVLMTF